MVAWPLGIWEGAVNGFTLAIALLAPALSTAEEVCELTASSQNLFGGVVVLIRDGSVMWLRSFEPPQERRFRTTLTPEERETVARLVTETRFFKLSDKMKDPFPDDVIAFSSVRMCDGRMHKVAQREAGRDRRYVAFLDGVFELGRRALEGEPVYEGPREHDWEPER